MRLAMKNALYFESYAKEKVVQLRYATNRSDGKACAERISDMRTLFDQE